MPLYYVDLKTIDVTKREEAINLMSNFSFTAFRIFNKNGQLEAAKVVNNLSKEEFEASPSFPKSCTCRLIS